MVWPYSNSSVQICLPTVATNKFIAVACAMQLTADAVVKSGASKASDITQPARSLERWLGQADDEQDGQLRRLLLVMVCEKADHSTPLDRVIALAKELHRHVTHG